MLRRKPHFALLLLTLSSFFLQGAASLSAPNSWAPVVTPMSAGRSNACSVLLRDGSTLFTGGTGQAGPLSSAELFGADNRFHSVPPMMNARSGHACALLPDGTVLVAGGRTSGGGITNAVEVFDPESMTWSSRQPMVEARAAATVSVLRDGRILIAGGDVSSGPSDSLEIYNAETGGFRHVEAALSSPRREHAATVLADGRVLLLGGSDGSKVLDTADLFDPATEHVTAAGKLKIARAGLTATTLLNGRVLIAGGSDGKNEIGAAEVFNPKSLQFQLDPSIMIAPRRDHTAVRIPGNNTVVIAGGTFQGRPLSQTEIYIPWRHRFQGAGDLASAKTAMTAGALRHAGKLLIAGGRNSSGIQSTAEIISVPTIATDKGDYHPGEPVTFSGSGWLPNKPVRIVMTEDSEIDQPGTIVTMADADGNISDSSFAPDLLDIGVKFYVTATQEGPLDANGQPTSLTAQTTFTDAANLKFTDGTGNTCANGANSYQSAGAAAVFGQNVCATATGLGAGSSTVTVTWIQPNSTIVFTSSVSLSNGNFQDIQAPNAAGQWTLNVYTDATLGTLLGTGTFFVGPFTGRLQFITGPFSLQTNTCSAANTIQLQDASNVPFTGLTFPTTVALSANPVGTTFYSDASCLTLVTSVIIPAGSSNTPSFYFKNSASGSVTLTGAAAGITNSATQVEAFTGSATHFSVSAPGAATAGTAFSFTVTALDASNSTVTGYSGTVHFTSTDGQAVLPANTTLTNGVGTFSATLKTSGSQTLTATDTVTGSITGTSATINVAAAAATHYTVSAPSSATANSAFSVTVTALDQFNNTATGYAGTVHFTSTDGAAVLPANSTLTSGVGTFSATLKTAASQTITATDTVTSSITGTSASISVAAGAATHYTVSAPGSATAGTAFSFTVTALDQSNNTATGYAGTVHFTSADGQAVLPANTTLASGVGTFSATLKTAGTQTITATDTVTGSITGTSGAIVVAAAAATHYTVSAPASATTNSAFTFTVTALDQFNNTAAGYGGTVHFTSSDGAAVLPANGTLTNGVGSFSATLKTVGSQTITATDTVTGSITGTSGAITVAAGTATHFSVSAPGSATAGTAFSFTVTALDASNSTATGYSGTVHFTSSDGQAVLPANATLVNGVGTFSATLKTAGTQTITATDTVTGSITGTSGAINLAAGAATHYTVSAPGSATAGTAFSFTVTALDQFNNTATAYAGTVHFTSIDAAAVLPANSTLVNGVGTFSATLKTAGSQTITATDTVTGSITGTSAGISVAAAAATHYSVSAPGSATANSAFSFTVTALDQFNNTATGYAGTVHLTSSDGAAVLPANSTLVNGVGTLSATLKTAGSQTITATDTVTGSITGTSATINVTAAAATHYTVSAPGSATAGTAFTFTVTALDQFNNTATTYAGTVHFTSADGQAVLPANSTLTNGVGTFSATLKTAGTQTIAATDSVTGSITGTSGAITVAAAAATHYTVSGPGSATANSSFSFTVTALDQFNNTATGYAGTVHFTSSDGAAVLPANSTLVNGVGTFSATLKTGGGQTITATDTVSGSITGTSGAIAVTAGAATHFTVSAPGSATAGTAFSFTVTALDASDLTATGYSGTVHFTGTDGQAVLPANATLTNGVGTFSATLKTSGNQTITATDTVTGSITGTSGAISVGAAAATHYTVSGPGSATANSASSFTVTALDPFNNTATGYAGTVHFTSTDGPAVLPANSTLVNGVGTFSATFKTQGSQTITATDTVSGSITGTSGAIAVTAGTATHFTVSAPLLATAGTSFSFTVTALDGSNNTAAGYAGTVHFTSTDGAAVLPANVTLVNGVGTFSATLKTAGVKTITATDTVNGSINGTSGAITVGAGAVTHFTISGPAQNNSGAPLSLTVTAVDAFGNTVTNYTGTVQFTSSDPQATLPPTYTFTGGDNGAHTFSATLQTSGSQSITVTDGTSSGTLPVTIGASASSVTLTASATSLTAGQIVALTATVVPSSSTGYVTFQEGSTIIGSAPLSSGIATFSLATLNPGTHIITAAYGNSTSGPVTLTITSPENSPVSLNVSVSENPATVGKPVIVTVSVNTSGSTPATGSVQFFDGPVLIGTASVINGQASLAITPTGGQPNLFVTYVGNLATASKAYGISVTRSSGGLSLASAPAVTTAGQSVTLTARMSGQGPAGLPGPTGEVQFFEGSVLIGTGSLVNGVAVLTISNMAAGNHQITATYKGDVNWNSASASAVVVVVSAIPSSTTLRFVSTNDGVTLAAKVANSTPGGVNPTGSVNFIDAASKTVIATAVLGGGEASAGIKPGQVKAGMKLVAVYAGDSVYAASTSDSLTVDTGLNAASYSPAPLAPDAIASLFPSGFASGATTQPKVETTSVRITDSAGMNYSALVFFVSPKQINFVIPPAVTAGAALVTVVGADGAVSVGAIEIAQVAPGMFSANSTGQGVASAWLLRAFADGSVSPRQNVAVLDSGDTAFVPAALTLNPDANKAYLEIYLTGIRHSSNLSLTIDGRVVPILFAGAHSQFAGLDQINVEIPASLKGAGQVKLTVTADGQTSNAVTVVIM